MPAMPAFGTPHVPSLQSPDLNGPNTPMSTYNNYNTSGNYEYTISSTPVAIQPDPHSVLIPMPANPASSQVDQLAPVYYPGMENLEQPIFDLNDLQNFFEWENAEAEPPPTGVEGLGPLGWNGLSNVQ